MLFREALQEMLAQRLFTQAVVAVPETLSPAMREKVEALGFPVYYGHESPHIRLAELCRQAFFDSIGVITPYACLVNKDALDEAWAKVDHGADGAYASGTIPAKEFTVLGRNAIAALSSLDSSPFPPALLPKRLRETGLATCVPLEGIESPAERFAWGTYFAGHNAVFPPAVLDLFFQKTDRSEWFTRSAHTRLLYQAAHINNLAPLDEALLRCGDDGGTTLASHVHFLRTLLPHLPTQGGTFLEVGCSRIPLVSNLLMNHFERGVAMDPFTYSEEGRDAAFALCDTLEQHASGLLPIPVKSGHGRPETFSSTLEELHLEESSVDFCFSKVVLEHVKDIPSLSRELFRVLKPGASMLHRIDFRDHGAEDEPVYVNFDFLAYSKEQWLAKNEETNLWRISDFVELWHEIGFTVETLERQHRKVAPSRLHPSWAEYDDEDLYCYDATLKATKPH
ncbi:methyltransferase domain-containing protein [Desulfovibrio inopinatus]|uniref:methyltransferase domain-containing protein n=1 Tax=Desulfovibrio inopinatus TaxID=102109 RepID=UPI0004262993|nr:methyltransferase domain-containing protein [Desulfovibrio inopinatus]